jgi:hypothetical protein
MKKRVLKGLSKHRLFYLGDSAPNFTGLVNGRRSDALGDSGSNVLVMDEDHARSLGLQILTEKAHRSRLIFVDSSMAYTSGLTKSVRWQFDFSGNRHGHFLDFHVLKNAPAEVILSDSFLFETEAFSQYECTCSMMRTRTSMRMLISSRSATILATEIEVRSFLEAIVFSLTVQIDSVDMSTIANIEFEEQCRLNRAKDEIKSLDGQHKDLARAQEDRRQMDWDVAMATKRRQSHSRQQTSHNPFVTAHAPPMSSGSPTGNGASQAAPQGPQPAFTSGSSNHASFQAQIDQGSPSRLRWLRLSLRFKRKSMIPRDTT